MKEEVLIIGGGPAGILTAYCLKNFGIKPIILEKGVTGQSWVEMRDGMVMLSPAVASHDMTSLSFDNPVWKYVKINGAFATKEEFVAYMNEFVRDNKIRIKKNCAVESIGKKGGLFEVRTEGGTTHHARVVVVATGVIDNPCLPDIEGIEKNPRVVHSRNYKGFENYRGKKVLIVGAGNSGAELTVELSGISQVTLVTSDKLKFFSRTNNLSHIRGLSESILKELIKFKIVSLREKTEVTRIDGDHVTFSDGSSEEFDEMIFATGYCPHMPVFEGIKVRVSKDCYPKVSSYCESTNIEGLYFTGPLAHSLKDCAFIHCFRPMIEPMALHIAEKFGR